MEKPLFSIIIPTFNRADTIIGTLKDIADQKFRSFEVIIVDDGSTDNTKEVVAPLLNDGRFTYYYKANGERAVARNYGIERSRGRYLTFLDSDDGYYPHCLTEAANFLSQHEQAVFFHLGYEIKDIEGKVLYRSHHINRHLNEKLLSGNFLSCINVFVKRDLLQLDRFNETPALVGSEDYELWLRLAAKYPLLYHGVIGGYMLQHGMRSVVNINRKNFNTRMQVLLNLVVTNPAVQKGYTKKQLEVFQHHTLLYWSLHLAMAGYKNDSLQILLRVLRSSPDLVVSRKFLGILKNLF